MDKKISIINCFFNNPEDVSKNYNLIKNYFEDKNINFEIIFINDNSPDETWSEIKEISFKDKKVKAICFKSNQGQQIAIKEAINISSGDYVHYYDSDLKFNEEFFDNFLKTHNKNYEVFWGIPNVSSTFLRNIFIFFYKFIFSKNYHYRSLFIFDSKIKNQIFDQYNDGKKFIGEILSIKKFINIKFNLSQNINFKNTSYTFFKRFSLAVDHFVINSEELFDKILISFFSIAILLFLFSIIILISKLIFSINIIPGWLSVVVLVAFLGSLILIFNVFFAMVNYNMLKNLKNQNKNIYFETHNID